MEIQDILNVLLLSVSSFFRMILTTLLFEEHCGTIWYSINQIWFPVNVKITTMFPNPFIQQFFDFCSIQYLMKSVVSTGPYVLGCLIDMRMDTFLLFTISSLVFLIVTYEWLKPIWREWIFPMKSMKKYTVFLYFWLQICNLDLYLPSWPRNGICPRNA